MKDIRLQIVKEDGCISSIHIYGKNLNRLAKVIKTLAEDCEINSFYREEMECLDLLASEVE